VQFGDFLGRCGALVGKMDRQEASDTRRADAEARILRAAEQVFAASGFKGATMQEIADQAGLPKANLSNPPRLGFGTLA